MDSLHSSEVLLDDGLDSPTVPDAELPCSGHTALSSDADASPANDTPHGGEETELCLSDLAVEPERAQDDDDAWLGATPLEGKTKAVGLGIGFEGAAGAFVSSDEHSASSPTLISSPTLRDSSHPTTPSSTSSTPPPHLLASSLSPPHTLASGAGTRPPIPAKSPSRIFSPAFEQKLASLDPHPPVPELPIRLSAEEAPRDMREGAEEGGEPGLGLDHKHETHVPVGAGPPSPPPTPPPPPLASPPVDRIAALKTTDLSPLGAPVSPHPLPTSNISPFSGNFAAVPVPKVAEAPEAVTVLGSPTAPVAEPTLSIPTIGSTTAANPTTIISPSSPTPEPFFPSLSTRLSLDGPVQNDSAVPQRSLSPSPAIHPTLARSGSGRVPGRSSAGSSNSSEKRGSVLFGFVGSLGSLGRKKSTNMSPKSPGSSSIRTLGDRSPVSDGHRSPLVATPEAEDEQVAWEDPMGSGVDKDPFRADPVSPRASPNPGSAARPTLPVLREVERSVARPTSTMPLPPATPPPVLHSSKSYSHSISSTGSGKSGSKSSKVEVDGPLPQFPCPRSELIQIQLTGDELSKFANPSGTSFLRSRKDWRTRYVTLTSLPPPSHSAAPFIATLHTFKNRESRERELDRLELTRDSVVCVPDDADGRMWALKVTGLAPRERDEHHRLVDGPRKRVSFLLGMDTVDSLKTWMEQLRAIVHELCTIVPPRPSTSGSERRSVSETARSASVTSGGTGRRMSLEPGSPASESLPSSRPSSSGQQLGSSFVSEDGRMSISIEEEQTLRRSLSRTRGGAEGDLGARRVTHMLAETTQSPFTVPESGTDASPTRASSFASTRASSFASTHAPSFDSFASFATASSGIAEDDADEEEDPLTFHPYRMAPSQSAPRDPSPRLSVPPPASPNLSRRGSGDDGRGYRINGRSIHDSDGSSLGSSSSVPLSPRGPPPNCPLPETPPFVGSPTSAHFPMPPLSRPPSLGTIGSNGNMSGYSKRMSVASSKRMSVASAASSGGSSYRSRMSAPPTLPPPTAALLPPPTNSLPFLPSLQCPRAASDSASSANRRPLSPSASYPHLSHQRFSERYSSFPPPLPPPMGALPPPPLPPPLSPLPALPRA